MLGSFRLKSEVNLQMCLGSDLCKLGKDHLGPVFFFSFCINRNTEWAYCALSQVCIP